MINNRLTHAVAQIEELCDDNEALLRQRIAEGRPLPKLYDSEITCAPSPVHEFLLDVSAIITRRFADVDELVAWRVAELRVEGEAAQVGAFQRIVPEGENVHVYPFVCVVRGDGKLEQPERGEHWKAPSDPNSRKHP